MSALNVLVAPWANKRVAIYKASGELQSLAGAARLLAEHSGDPADAEFASELEQQARRLSEFLSRRF